MAAIDSFVEVFITKNTQQIDITSFSIPMILSAHSAFTERARVYTSLTGVAEDFDTTSETYIIAQKLFSQELVFPQIVIGRKEELESYSDALFAVQEENDSFYAVVIDSHDKADVLAFAQTIEAMPKIFGTSTSDVLVKSASSTTDVGAELQALNLDRTFVLWSADADTQYPEAAWLHQLLEVPGSNTWALKELNGITVSRLSETDVTVLTDKNVNFFRSVKGAPIVMSGTMASGTWLDETIFLDWWKARVQEAIFYRLINSRKIPYTQTGATIIEAEIRAINAQGIANGGIADSPAPTVQAPNVLAIPEMIRATRVMGDFIVTFRLSGAVHRVSAVRATVSV